VPEVVAFTSYTHTQLYNILCGTKHIMTKDTATHAMHRTVQRKQQHCLSNRNSPEAVNTF
jgi:hypothetical protein